MRALTLAFVLGLCCLGACTLDETSFIQAELEAWGSADAADSPPQLPSFLKQLPEAALLGNMSTFEVMTMGAKVLRALRDRDFLRAVNSSFGEFLGIVRTNCEGSRVRVAELEAAGRSITDKEGAYRELRSFFRKQQDASFKSAESLAEQAMILIGAMPNMSLNLPGRVITKSSLSSIGVEGFADAFKQHLGGFTGKILECPDAALCTTLQPMVGNMTLLDSMLAKELSMTPQVEAMIPRVTGLVRAFAPDAAEVITALLRDHAGPMTAGIVCYNQAQHSTLEAVRRVSTSHTHCLSSARVCAGPSLLLAVAVLATWVLPRA